MNLIKIIFLIQLISLQAFSDGLKPDLPLDQFQPDEVIVFNTEDAMSALAGPHLSRFFSDFGISNPDFEFIVENQPFSRADIMYKTSYDGKESVRTVCRNVGSQAEVENMVDQLNSTLAYARENDLELITRCHSYFATFFLYDEKIEKTIRP